MYDFDFSPRFAERFSGLIEVMKKSLSDESELRLNPKNDAERAMVDIIVQNLGKIAILTHHLSKNSKRSLDNQLMEEMYGSMEAFFDYLINPSSPADIKEAVDLSKRTFDKVKTYTEYIYKPDSNQYLSKQVFMLILVCVNIVSSQRFCFEGFPYNLMHAFATAIHGVITADPHCKNSLTFHRRLAVMTMAGGFPVDHINKQQDFPFQLEQFDKSKIAFKPVDPNLNSRAAEESFGQMMKCVQNGKIDKQAQVALFWEPIMYENFNEKVDSWKICKDFDLKPSLDLDGSRKSDIVIMSSRFNLPILTVDVSEGLMKHGSEHPGYMKTMTNMSVSCIQLAEQMKNCGLDPVDARTFGILVGKDKAHLLICFPTMVLSSAQTTNEVYTCVCMNDAWFIDFSSKLYASNAVLNVNSYKKLSGFLETVKDTIKKSEVKVANPGKNAVKNDFDKPNVSYVFKPKAKIDLLSREQKLRATYTEGIRTTQQTSKSELQFYRSKLADYFAFPKLLESRVETDGSVTLTLEKLLPLMGNGIFGPYGGGKCFCPGVIRAENADSLMIDAAVFAVHALFGLFVLHEQLRHLHANISPESIKYSPVDRMWKLTGFDSIIPLKEAHKTVRKCDDPSNIYISPETKKTGIFDKKTDVYGLGNVIWNTFHNQIMWLIECGEINSKTHVVYDKFVDILRKMTCEDPAKRSNVLQSMKPMMDLIKENPFN